MPVQNGFTSAMITIDAHKRLRAVMKKNETIQGILSVLAERFAAVRERAEKIKRAAA